jgi:xanthine dehydrogenase YagT iron-sulfur-binding subunit
MRDPSGLLLRQKGQMQIDPKKNGAVEPASIPQSLARGPVEVSCDWPVSRREFVAGAGAAAVVAAIGQPAWAAPDLEAQPTELTASSAVSLSLIVNGEQKQLNIDPRTSLLDLLREDLKLTGTKKGCDHGQCGACTVLVNDRRINSCLTLAVSMDGDRITTIEGLAKGEELHPVQQAFLDNDGFQCGYCTPGQIVSVVALISEAKTGAASVVTRDLRQAGAVELTDDEIRERMSGNICRCGAYPGIIAAVRQVIGKPHLQTALDAHAKEDSSATL